MEVLYFSDPPAYKMGPLGVGVRIPWALTVMDMVKYRR